jgi:hypothetical protein
MTPDHHRPQKEEQMDGEELARSWKDAEGRDEPTEEHPAGRIGLRARAQIGARAALLSGLVLATAVTASLPVDTGGDPSILPTIGY